MRSASCRMSPRINAGQQKRKLALVKHRTRMSHSRTRRRHAAAGFTLVEVLVALMVVAIGLAA
jgi:prepilin-type N-terminal cleavage/methylation domain-containing protein